MLSSLQVCLIISMGVQAKSSITLSGSLGRGLKLSGGLCAGGRRCPERQGEGCS